MDRARARYLISLYFLIHIRLSWIDAATFGRNIDPPTWLAQVICYQPIDELNFLVRISPNPFEFKYFGNCYLLQPNTHRLNGK